MDPSGRKIYIIGAGISGLVAARTLEERGFSPVILEGTDSPGGRVKTDQVNGVLFDRGFQVLLTAYPEAKKHLDFEQLDLYRFSPGALIFAQGTMQRVGDPVRDASTLWATLLASIGSIGDKWKIYRLSSALKKKPLPEIFRAEEQSTHAYLKALGFSDRIIRAFFKPFFTGIFLEEELRTSSRMFEFTFKMFSEGYAAIPSTGIGAISKTLADSLERTTIHYNRRVRKVSSDAIVMEGGEVLQADATLVTVPMDPKTGELNTRVLSWKRCDNLYFAVTDRTFPEGIIGLVADEASLVNNLYYPFGQYSDGDPVLSVTVVKDHALDQDTLVERIGKELSHFCGITPRKCLKHYSIQQALPDLSEVCMESTNFLSPSLENVYLAGDYLLNASLNAAMASGEAAAKAMADSLDA